MILNLPAALERAYRIGWNEHESAHERGGDRGLRRRDENAHAAALEILRTVHVDDRKPVQGSPELDAWAAATARLPAATVSELAIALDHRLGEAESGNAYAHFEQCGALLMALYTVTGEPVQMVETRDRLDRLRARE